MRRSHELSPLRYHPPVRVEGKVRRRGKRISLLRVNAQSRNEEHGADRVEHLIRVICHVVLIG
jgi:hypothetical protein